MIKPDIKITIDHGAHNNKTRVQVICVKPISKDVMVYDTDTEAFEAATAISRAFVKFGKVVDVVMK